MKIKQTLLVLIAILAVGVVTVGAAPMAFAQDCPDTSILEIECNNSNETKDSGVWQLLVMALNILTAGVGIAAVGGMVYAAILYASARQQADQVKKAKDIMLNIVIGLVSYAGMYLIVNFLIPGGLFS
jgi:amino acid transporter